MAGLFIQRHAEAIASEQVDIEVFFAIAEPGITRVEVETEQRAHLQITRLYFPRSRFFIGPVARLWNVYRVFLYQKRWIKARIKAGARPDLVHVHVLTRSALAAVR